MVFYDHITGVTKFLNVTPVSYFNVSYCHYGCYQNITGVTHLIANYMLIDGAKSDPYRYLNKGTYPIYHDVILFAIRLTSKIDLFWVGFYENHPYLD